MTGLVVAEPQPLWLSLQHTPPSLGIAAAVAHAAAGVADVAVEPAHAAAGAADALVVIPDSAAVLAEFADPAGLQLHLFGFQFPLMEINLVISHTCIISGSNITYMYTCILIILVAMKIICAGQAFAKVIRFL